VARSGRCLQRPGTSRSVDLTAALPIHHGALPSSVDVANGRGRWPHCPGRTADLALSLTFSGCVLGVELRAHAYARRSLSLLAAAPPSHSASTAIMASTWKRLLADYARWRLIHPAKDTSSSRKRETSAVIRRSYRRPPARAQERLGQIFGHYGRDASARRGRGQGSRW